jgi:NAD(P)-dependent dehydrogenase (short-subunit alcohol dehydrogenase family)
MRLQGKVAIVTGAADGIGAAIARAFAHEGARVFLSDIDRPKGEAEVAGIRAHGGSAEFVSCDVAENDQVVALIAKAAKAGRIDVLVNNAAVAIGGMPLHQMNEDQWARLVAVNLTSVYRTCREVLPQMIAQGAGSIVNISSAQGHIGLPGWTAYAGAKGAIMAMTRQMAVEFGPAGIRVNSISPGTIATPMNEKIAAEVGAGVVQSWIGMHPIGRIGRPEEVAEAAVYLASDAAGFTTGADLRVDGGLTVTPRFIPHG